MKLHPDYMLCEMGDDVVLVPTGEATKRFQGVIRCNESAQFILNCLEEETTEEALLSKMEQEYDAERELLAQGLQVTLEKLRSIGALAE